MPLGTAPEFERRQALVPCLSAASLAGLVSGESGWYQDMTADSRYVGGDFGFCLRCGGERRCKAQVA